MTTGGPPYARGVLRRLLAPRMLLLHALAVAAVVVTVLLGVWQLGAWQAARELEAQDLADTAPVPLDSALGPDSPFTNDQVGRPVTLAGEWLPESTLEVVDRPLGDRTGRWVVTPVAVCDEVAACDTAPAILVVRGWLGEGDPLPEAPQGRTAVTGWLQPGEGNGLPDDDRADRELPELRLASAIQYVDQDLYGGYVVARDLTGPAAAGLEPVTPESLPEVGAVTSLRNLLYAIEWWVFAVFAIHIWQRWVRDELAREDAAEAATPAGIPSAT